MNRNRLRPATELAMGLLGAAALGALALISAGKILILQLNIISSDSLYLPLLREGDLLSFRSPSASYLFPDLLYYVGAHIAGLNVVDSLIIAGLLQCSIATMLIVRYCGILPAIAYNFLYYEFGLAYYFVISFHQGLIVMTALYLRFTSPNARSAMSVIFTIADPLFAFILSVYLAAKALLENHIDRQSVLLIAVGYSAAFYLCESSTDLVKFAPIVLGVLLAGWITTLQHVRPTLIRLTEVLVRLAVAPESRQYRICSLVLLSASLFSLVLGQPLRYALPISVSSIIFFTWQSDKSKAQYRRSWLTTIPLSILSFCSLYVFVRPALENTAHAFLARYTCLEEKLQLMRISSVATDYWTFKPLYFSRVQGARFDMLQLNFRTGKPYTWINDHRFVRGKSNHIIKNLARCNSISPSSQDWSGSCSDTWYSTLGVNARTEVCGAFEIIETSQPIDFSAWSDAFVSKSSAFRYNLTTYVDKAFTSFAAMRSP